MSRAGTDATVTVGVVVVTYDSGSVIQSCLTALERQSRLPDLVVVVDNNSPHPGFLDEIADSENLPLTLIRNPINEGFCAANNRGYPLVEDCTYVMFLNPDAFPQSDVIRRSVEWMERPENNRVGALTGTLLKFDMRSGRRTGAIDSTGVFQTWYGKWYDRDQGKAWSATVVSPSTEDLPAMSGALMFCRSGAIESVRTPDGDVFDRRFFMYKEDIDLSLRFRKRGWRLVHWPALICDHCRGWRGRRHMSSQARYLSARNELRVCRSNNRKGWFYSGLKFLFVPLESLFIKVFPPGPRGRGPHD